MKVAIVNGSAKTLNLILKSVRKESKLDFAWSAKNGEEALDKAIDSPPDMILMDMLMPVMDGVEATTTIRKGAAGEHNKSIPIIAMTAYAMDGDKEKFLAAGMNGYIAKPVDMEQLESILMSVGRTNRDG